LWKLKENSKYVKYCAFEENNNKNVLIGYWEQENNELSIVTNQSKTYLAVKLKVMLVMELITLITYIILN
jgi:hypothetical protein